MFIIPLSLSYGTHLDPLCWPSIVRALVTPSDVVLIQLKACRLTSGTVHGKLLTQDPGTDRSGPPHGIGG